MLSTFKEIAPVIFTIVPSSVFCNFTARTALQNNHDQIDIDRASCLTRSHKTTRLTFGDGGQIHEPIRFVAVTKAPQAPLPNQKPEQE
jgi:hypothetical protein